MSKTNFSDLNLSPQIQKAIDELGFETPTPIQSEAIPHALAGKDVLGQAQTGTGKTAAFGLPILELVDREQGLQSIIVCPTRELAVQVADEISRLGKHTGIKILPIYGGQSIDHQIRALKKRPEIIAGTPGRILDHLKRRTIKLHDIKMAVLDEADEMLDMGFLEDIQEILEQSPKDKQTMLFSATMAPAILSLAKTFMVDPVVIKIKSPELTVPLVEQRYYEVNPKQKIETLCRVLDIENPQVSIIFTRTKKGADELVRDLQLRGYAAEALHGDMSQRERDNVMGRFRQGTVETLVATDVAARGLDVNHVTHVFNFDIPQDSDTYVHRIGRTGRAGRHGIAITLVTPREAKQLKFIEKDIKKQIKRHPLPTLAEVIEKRQQQLVNSIVSELDSPLGDFKPAALQLLENYDSESLLAAALKIIAQNDKSIEMTELEDAHPDKVTIQVPFGRIHGLRAKSLVDLIVSNTVLRPKEVGDIQVFDTVSNVEVPAKLADQVYASLINMKAPKKGGRGKGNERGTAGPARGAGKDRGAKERNAGKERAAGKGGSPAKTRKAKVRSAY